jgi:hypothetical protein
MPLRKGDSVSVSVNPTIRFTQYDSFKTMVTVRRELNEQPKEDLADLLSCVRALYFKALHREISLWKGCNSALGEVQDVDALVALVKKEAGVVPVSVVVEKTTRVKP